MIGKVLEHPSWQRSQALNTVRTDAIGEQFRCVKCNKWNRTT
jgi:cytochrome c-type biogenesis protein CcmH/NrfF